MKLNLIESRIIGCLLEKEITTPEQYPLSLNALTMACNQKTSREPVMALTETDVQIGIDELNKKRLIHEQSGFGSRVIKYKHRFCNTEFSDIQLSAQQLAIICVLLLRGPQTAGELRTRAARLYEFKDINSVEETLKQLVSKDDPYISQLPKEPGKREIRFKECFSLHNDVQQEMVKTPSKMQDISDDQKLESRLEKLENKVAELTILMGSLLDKQQGSD